MLLGRAALPFQFGGSVQPQHSSWGSFSSRSALRSLCVYPECRVAGSAAASGLWASGLTGNTWCSRLQRGLGWPSPAQQRARALGPGEAAHLAVASARLVHEGAVLTGPHGRGGSTCRAPDCTVLLEAWKLHADSACRVKSKGERITSAP